MSPKERRLRLFKKNRPHFRPLQIYDGDKYHNDIAVLWASHSKQPFYSISEVTDQKEFADFFERLVTTHDVMIAEDQNSSFKKKRGPIAFVSCWSDGWRIEPHVEFMYWATSRNMLRSTVAFFQMMRNRTIGVCVVRALKDSTNLFNQCFKYGVLRFVGKVENGDRRGDEYIYSVRGRRNVKSN